MAFGIAKHVSTCSLCNKAVVPGQEISWGPRAGAGKAVHRACFDSKRSFGNPVPDGEFQPIPETGITPQAAPTPASTPNNNNGVEALLASALLPFLEGKLTSKVSREDVTSILDERMNGKDIETLVAVAVSEALDKHVRKIVIETRDADNKVETKDLGIQHCKFEWLLKLVQARMYVYMYGDAGWGKTQAARSVATALGLEFYYISLNAQSSAYRLDGFIGADGKTFVETNFYKAYTEGGVYCIDEMDRASGNLLTSLNGALANGHASFPIGMRPKHKDFVCVATGNTSGRGGSSAYNAAQPLDASTLDRFVFLNWGEDNNFEMEIVKTINPDSEARQWAKYVQRVRAYAKTNFPRLIVSPRASYDGAKMLKIEGFSVDMDLADAALFRGLEKDSVNKILAACPLPN